MNENRFDGMACVLCVVAGTAQSFIVVCPNNYKLINLEQIENRLARYIAI